MQLYICTQNKGDAQGYIYGGAWTLELFKKACSPLVLAPLSMLLHGVSCRGEEFGGLMMIKIRLVISSNHNQRGCGYRTNTDSLGSVVLLPGKSFRPYNPTVCPLEGGSGGIYNNSCLNLHNMVAPLLKLPTASHRGEDFQKQESGCTY